MARFENLRSGLTKPLALFLSIGLIVALQSALSISNSNAQSIEAQGKYLAGVPINRWQIQTDAGKAIRIGYQADKGAKIFFYITANYQGTKELVHDVKCVFNDGTIPLALEISNGKTTFKSIEWPVSDYVKITCTPAGTTTPSSVDLEIRAVNSLYAPDKFQGRLQNPYQNVGIFSLDLNAKQSTTIRMTASTNSNTGYCMSENFVDPSEKFIMNISPGETISKDFNSLFSGDGAHAYHFVCIGTNVGKPIDISITLSESFLRIFPSEANPNPWEFEHKDVTPTTSFFCNETVQLTFNQNTQNLVVTRDKNDGSVTWVHENGDQSYSYLVGTLWIYGIDDMPAFTPGDVDIPNNEGKMVYRMRVDSIQSKCHTNPKTNGAQKAINHAAFKYPSDTLQALIMVRYNEDGNNYYDFRILRDVNSNLNSGVNNGMCRAAFWLVPVVNTGVSLSDYAMSLTGKKLAGKLNEKIFAKVSSQLSPKTMQQIAKSLNINAKGNVADLSKDQRILEELAELVYVNVDAFDGVNEVEEIDSAFSQKVDRTTNQLMTKIRGVNYTLSDEVSKAYYANQKADVVISHVKLAIKIRDSDYLNKKFGRSAALEISETILANLKKSSITIAGKEIPLYSEKTKTLVSGALKVKTGVEMVLNTVNVVQSTMDMFKTVSNYPNTLTSYRIQGAQLCGQQ